MSPWPPPDDAPLRIVFMGSPGIARPCIDRLIGGPEQVVAIYCQPDKRAGRGRKLTPPPIAHCAAENAIPLYQPRGLRKPEEQERFASLKPDFAVVVAYGKILPPAILAIPRYGCINVHFSLLPAYRGAGPVQWAIIRGERETGVTTMQIVIPLVMTYGMFGGGSMILKTTSGTLIGKIAAGTETWIHNAGFVWLLILIPLAFVTWFWMNNLRAEHVSPNIGTPLSAFSKITGLL